MLSSVAANDAGAETDTWCGTTGRERVSNCPKRLSQAAYRSAPDSPLDGVACASKFVEASESPVKPRMPAVSSFRFSIIDVSSS
jgi:hypothetical protein